MQKSYYAIIPANVRYDRDLIPSAKLLYGEITALCNEKGYCWAENSYFAELYGVSKTSISKWIKSLIDGGYIRSHLVYKEGTKEIEKRCITISEYPIEEKLNTPLTFVNDTIEEKLKDNNTTNTTMNDLNNRAKRFVPPTVEEVKAYCQERKNNVDAEAFVNFYESKGWYVGKNKMKDWQAAVRTWEKSNNQNKSQDTTPPSYDSDAYRQKAQNVPVYERKK